MKGTGPLLPKASRPYSEGENYPNPYETLKALTRTGSGINHKTISDFIDGLDVSSEVKEELRAITPETYTGF